VAKCKQDILPKEGIEPSCRRAVVPSCRDGVTPA
jgi:hypothetical protein